MEKERRFCLFKRSKNPNTTQYYETAANLGDTGKLMHAIGGHDITDPDINPRRPRCHE